MHWPIIGPTHVSERHTHAIVQLQFAYLNFKDCYDSGAFVSRLIIRFDYMN